jgi:hypothetical protein
MRQILSLFLSLVFLLSGCFGPKIPQSPAVYSANSPSGDSAIVIVVIPKKINKAVTPNVVLEWISPTTSDLTIKNIDGKVEIKVKIISEMPITIEQINILVNGQPSGNKAGEVTLLRRPEYKDQVLSAYVPIDYGTNFIQVAVIPEFDRLFVAEKAVERFADGKILVKNTGTVNTATRISWIKPDKFVLSGEMFMTKERELEVAFSISTPYHIAKDSLSLFLNNQYLSPSPRAELIGDNGNYSFRDYLPLKEGIIFNEVALRVRTVSEKIESERLKINYSPLRPNLYVLSIGPKINLEYSAKDAKDFAELFASQLNFSSRLFNTVFIDTLIGKRATSTEIKGMIESIGNKWRTGAIAPDDLIIVYISSHGFLDEQGLLRIQGDDYTPERRRTTSVSYNDDILYHLERLPCKKILLMDACHSGDYVGARANPVDVNNALLNYRSSQNGLTVFGSSSKDQLSYEDSSWENGAFTEALALGLSQGKADVNQDKIITLSELEAFVIRSVPEMVRAVKNKIQIPVMRRNDLGDIPIFMY